MSTLYQYIAVRRLILLSAVTSFAESVDSRYSLTVKAIIAIIFYSSTMMYVYANKVRGKLQNRPPPKGIRSSTKSLRFSCPQNI